MQAPLTWDVRCCSAGSHTCDGRSTQCKEGSCQKLKCLQLTCIGRSLGGGFLALLNALYQYLKERSSRPGLSELTQLQP
eukprot:130277-Pelagomonas_calceolata.AAC.4